MCVPTTPFKIAREWNHAGLRCAVTQAFEAGHHCGYVRLPPSHPLYGKDSEAFSDIDAHGSINFAEPEPCEHEDGKGWWIGFDFAHAFDAHFDPNVDLDTLSEGARLFMERWRSVRKEVRGDYIWHEHYWTQAEAERECESVAEQVAEVTK
jgi:hypothetical protein